MGKTKHSPNRTWFPTVHAHSRRSRSACNLMYPIVKCTILRGKSATLPQIVQFSEPSEAWRPPPPAQKSECSLTRYTTTIHRKVSRSQLKIRNLESIPKHQKEVLLCAPSVSSYAVSFVARADSYQERTRLMSWGGTTRKYIANISLPHPPSHWRNSEESTTAGLQEDRWVARKLPANILNAQKKLKHPPAPLDAEDSGFVRGTPCPSSTPHPAVKKRDIKHTVTRGRKEREARRSAAKIAITSHSSKGCESCDPGGDQCQEVRLSPTVVIGAVFTAIVALLVLKPPLLPARPRSRPTSWSPRLISSLSLPRLLSRLGFFVSPLTVAVCRQSRTALGRFRWPSSSPPEAWPLLHSMSAVPELETPFSSSSSKPSHLACSSSLSPITR